MTRSGYSPESVDELQLTQIVFLVHKLTLSIDGIAVGSRTALLFNCTQYFLDQEIIMDYCQTYLAIICAASYSQRV